MPVKVRCPGCEKVLNAPSAAAGKSIRCPDCSTKVPVPAENAAKASKAPSKKAAKASEDFANLDLSRLEDSDASICRKCGTEVPEDATECPNCGVDLLTGGLGETARKKQMKGPDPDRFYENLWQNGWKFVNKHQMLSWRSILYTLIVSLIVFGSAFMFLWVSTAPPRAFWALIGIASLMVLPGWYWFYDVEVIRASMEQKDKLKRVNFDIFLCSALGLKFIGWQIAVALPILLIPYLIGYFVIVPGDFDLGLKVLYFLCVQGLLLPLLPVAMSHMAMPVPTPGWMFWKVLQIFGRTAKASLTWAMYAVATNIVSIGCVVVIAVVYATPLWDIRNDMEHNAKVAYAKFALDQLGPAKQAVAGKKAASEEDKAAAEKEIANRKQLDEESKLEPKKVDYSPLIVPSILWVVAVLAFGWTAPFSMRTNGQFTYFNKTRLQLIGREKEYKYIAKEKTDDDEELEKPKGLQEAIATVAICALLGGIGGMLTATLAFPTASSTAFAMVGALIGLAIATLIGWFGVLPHAFRQSTGIGMLTVFLPPVGAAMTYQKEPKESKFGVLTLAFALVGLVGVFVATLAMGVNVLSPPSTGSAGPAAPAPAAAPAGEQPAPAP